jgi:hypothetical protein
MTRMQSKFQEAMDEMHLILAASRKLDVIDTFEAWAALYFQRCGEMAPGKSRPMGVPENPDNAMVYEAWHQSGLASQDAIKEVVRLLKKIAAMNEAHDTREAALEDQRDAALAEVARYRATLQSIVDMRGIQHPLTMEIRHDGTAMKNAARAALTESPTP